jgi:DNA-binding NarL/FixJ family response regulator
MKQNHPKTIMQKANTASSQSTPPSLSGNSAPAPSAQPRQAGPLLPLEAVSASASELLVVAMFLAAALGSPQALWLNDPQRRIKFMVITDPGAQKALEVLERQPSKAFTTPPIAQAELAEKIRRLLWWAANDEQLAARLWPMPSQSLSPACGTCVPLTRREGEIYCRKALGFTAKEISTALTLAIRTVENNLYNIRCKLPR